MSKTDLILASQSPARAQLLKRAGVKFSTRPAHIDEEAIRDSLMADNAGPDQIAEVLAEMKAQKISNTVPDALVIGGDQILECNGQIYAKAADHAELASQLSQLSGKTHRLYTSAIVAKGGQRLWHTQSVPALTMRTLTPETISQYMASAGKAVLGSVGGYMIEDRGVQLFHKIEGDLSAVQGLPIIELLNFLRPHGLEGLIT